MLATKADIKDATRIAELHMQSINKGFLSVMGKKFLICLYTYLIKKEIVIVVKTNGTVAGYVSYSYNSSGIVKRFVFSVPRSLLFVFLRLLKRPGLIFSVLESVKAPVKSNSSVGDIEIPEGELLSISVDPEYQKSGMGLVLLNALETELKSKDVLSYKVVAGCLLISANRFYSKYGFVKVKEITIHGNSKSNLYVKSL